MLFFSIGLPSRFAEWCDAIALRLVERALGGAELASLSTPGDIGEALVRSRGNHLVASARHPVERLRAALAAADYPFIFVMDAPYTALENLVVGHGIDLVSATRAMACSCAAMIPYSLMPNACVLRSEQQRDDPVGAAATIARCFGLELSEAAIGEIVSSLAAAAGDEMAAQSWWDGLDASQRELAAGALGGYSEYFGGGRLGALKWTRELFYLGDDPHRSASQAIDMAGHVRNLLFGPYIVLPPGSWGANVSLAISRDAVGMDFGVEFLAGPRCARLAYAKTLPDKEGICHVGLAFSVDGNTDQPISLRVHNLQPCLGGKLAFVDVGLSAAAVTEAPTPIPAEITAALGL